MPYLVAVLGFDERHVIKSLLRLGFKNVRRVYLVVPYGRTGKQTEEAIKRIKEIAEMAGTGADGVKTLEVDPLNFSESVGKIRRLLMEMSAGCEEVVVSLGGGMRVLVLETLVASLLVPRELRGCVKIVSDLETGEGFVELWASDMLLASELKPDELLTLSYLLKRGSAGPTDVGRDLKMPKTTAWKILSRLSRRGLLTRLGREYRLSDVGVRVARVAAELVDRLPPSPGGRGSGG